MRKSIIYILLIATLSGCELYIIGAKREKIIEINQQSSIGVVYLFKTELDSNNIRGATQILAQPSGNFYLAIEKYEMFEEMERMARIIGRKPITDFTTDTLSATNHKIVVHFDYITIVNFTAEKISDNWYITQYQERMRWY
ncbi:lipoprotein [Bacteroidota bacterium]